MRYAFIDSDGIVVQLLKGELSAIDQARFIADYDVLFGSSSIVPVADADVTVWIGGAYDFASGSFSPPPTPEPEAVIEEIIPE